MATLKVLKKRVILNRMMSILFTLISAASLFMTPNGPVFFFIFIICLLLAVFTTVHASIAIG